MDNIIIHKKYIFSNRRPDIPYIFCNIPRNIFIISNALYNKYFKDHKYFQVGLTEDKKQVVLIPFKEKQENCFSLFIYCKKHHALSLNSFISFNLKEYEPFTIYEDNMIWNEKEKYLIFNLPEKN